MDSSTWQTYAKMDPELEAMLPHLPPGKSFADYPDVPTLRKSIEEQIIQGVTAGIFKIPEMKGITKQDLQIPMRDGSSIRAVHYRPESGEKGPLLVYYHGGGWTFGQPEAWETNTEMLVQQLGFVVVSVDYRMAPEIAFPVAHNDAWDSLKWVAENAEKLNADPAKGFMVGGTSAGGNLAAVVSHIASDENLSPPLTGQHLSIPALLHPDAVPAKYEPHFKSWVQNKDAMILDERGMKWFHDQYKSDTQSHLTSPLNWPSGHQKQPPTYFAVCGMDPLRDESLIFEHVLREEYGVPTRVNIYKGLPHAAPDFMPMLSQSKQSLIDVKEGFQWLLSQKST